MHLTQTSTGGRPLRRKEIHADLAVVGGGLAGVCCAITAAREGISVLLVQDRPVLGGNASSEIRLWVLGATSHMGNNNRWAREGGVIDELLVENMWRNPEGNAILLDAIILEFVQREPNITLLLNTAVYECDFVEDGLIRSVGAFCSQNQIHYTLSAPLFCDASGDGILGFLSGAAFRVGAEAHSELGEALAPVEANGELLGHSLYFYSRDTGSPVTYVPPAYALQDISGILRHRELRVTDSGCRLWWLEYGGDRDTVFETEEIKWELWRVAYGLWNYIKNSGKFPEAATLTLEWVGTIPGKRESRRFEGDSMLTQQDIVEQRTHPDAVSFGGWAIDLHPSDGVYSEQPGCTQWHSKGIYQIPYSTMYSRNVRNLFLAGRIISASHIAFGSTRVMATCAHNAQAVGMAAAFCREDSLLPRDLLEPERMHRLQQRLLRSGQHIPGIAATDVEDLAQSAVVTASSALKLAELPFSGETAALDDPMALLLPLAAGKAPSFTFQMHSQQNTTLGAELWTAKHEGNTTPDLLLASATSCLAAGSWQPVSLEFNTSLAHPAHAFVMLHPEPGVTVQLSRQQVTGVLTLAQRMNKAVAKEAVQSPPAGSGIDSFAFWLPQRRPAARNLAVQIAPPLAAFDPSNVVNGFSRPWLGSNAWLPDPADPDPRLTLRWSQPQAIRVIEITFDTDFDHPMESVLMGHPERVMPACITAFDICDEKGRLLAHERENHQTRWKTCLDEPCVTAEITIHVREHGPAVPAIFQVRCY